MCRREADHDLIKAAMNYFLVRRLQATRRPADLTGGAPGRQLQIHVSEHSSSLSLIVASYSLSAGIRIKTPVLRYQSTVWSVFFSQRPSFDTDFHASLGKNRADPVLLARETALPECARSQCGEQLFVQLSPNWK